MPLVCNEEHTVCGTCSEYIVDFRSGTVVAIAVTESGIMNRHRHVLLLQDIVEWNDDAIHISTTDALADPSDVVRLTDVLTTKHELTHLPVQTVSGTKLGVVLDFIFDDVSGTIVKFYVGKKKLLGHPDADYVITQDAVERITPDMLIVHDAIATEVEQEFGPEKGFAAEPI